MADRKTLEKELEKEINKINKIISKGYNTSDEFYNIEDKIYSIPGIWIFTADWKDIQDLSEQFLKFCKEQNIDLKKYL